MLWEPFCRRCTSLTGLVFVLHAEPVIGADEAAGYSLTTIGLLIVGVLIVVGVMRGLLFICRRTLNNFTRELKSSEERLQLALWGSGDFLWDWDAQTGDLYCGDFAEYLGFSFEKGTRTIDAMLRVIHPDDQIKVGESLNWYLAKHDSLELEVRIKNSDDQWRWILWRGRVVSRNAAGEPRRVTGTCKDITSRKEAETELKLAAAVMENSNDAICIIDRNYNFVKVNRMFEKMTGWKVEEVIGQPSSILNSGRHDPETYEQIHTALKTFGSWTGELYERRKSGENFLSLLHLKSITDGYGTPTHYVAVFSDITSRRKSEEELRYLANYDSLTGLPNRTLFRERLAHAIVKSRRRNQNVAVLFVDLDNFKQVNDSLGHAVGDGFLRAAGARIAGCVREEDTVARLGGDEFTLIVEGVSAKDHVGRIARTILDAFQEPIAVEQNRLTITLSIGISVFPDDGLDDMDLIQNADIAMYHAKNEGRNNLQFYTPAMSTTARDRLKLENDLRSALDHDEFVLHYQPKVETETGKVCGVEALVRWDAPEAGLLYPGDFIFVAEERGLISRLGEWVLRQGCKDIMQLRQDTGLDLGLAVNLSARQISEPGLVDMVDAALKETRFPAAKLQLEITESLIMENASDSLQVLHDLKALGIKLVVDDFGTGYSSLSYLKRFPIDHIKIDKTFVQDLHHDDFAIAIVTAIIAMASSLNLGVTAEGVETEEQRNFLRGLGCHELQGYYFSRPIPRAELIDFLASLKTSTAQS